MQRNLRSVIERVTRGGRSVVSRRNFSSSLSRNVSEGSGDSVAYSVVRLLYLAAGYGFGNYYLGEEKDKEIEEYQQKVLDANKEEIYDIKTNQCTRLYLKVKKIHNETFTSQEKKIKATQEEYLRSLRDEQNDSTS